MIQFAFVSVLTIIVSNAVATCLSFDAMSLYFTGNGALVLIQREGYCRDHLLVVKHLLDCLTVTQRQMLFLIQ